MRYVGVGSFHTGGRAAATKFLYVISVTIGDALYMFFLSTVFFFYINAYFKLIYCILQLMDRS